MVATNSASPITASTWPDPSWRYAVSGHATAIREMARVVKNGGRQTLHGPNTRRQERSRRPDRSDQYRRRDQVEMRASNLDVESIAQEIAKVIPGIPLTLARAHAQCLIQLDPQTLGQALDGSIFESWQTDDLLESITCPVLLLVGDVSLGGALTSEEAKRAEKALATCRTVFMGRVGHMIHTEQPKTFAEAVRTFLDSLNDR